MAEIARAAGVPPSSIYVYFGSKLDVLWGVMEPWLLDRFDRLEAELGRIEDPRARLERLLTALWRDIPRADGGLAANLVQGVALAEAKDNYSRDLLRRLEVRITRMLAGCLPPARRHLLDEADSAAHLAFMAFDGFVLSARVARSERLGAVIALMVDLLLGGAAPDGAPDGAASQASAIGNDDRY